MATTIDKATKVNLAILFTLLGIAALGAWYASSMKHSIDDVVSAVAKLEAAVEKNTATLVADGQEVAILRTRMDALEVRVERLEGR